LGSQSKTVYHQPNGYITNKKYLEKRDYKEMYQTMHSNFLAQPKIKNERFDIQTSLDKNNDTLNPRIQKSIFDRNLQQNVYEKDKIKYDKHLNFLSPNIKNIAFQKENLDFDYKRK
jgi:hypothetical protein